MIAVLAAFLVSFAASLTVESFPPSLAAARAPWRALALRLLLHVGLFAAAFALSWRPWHAALVVTVVAFLFGLGSATKRGILGEPLTFNDFALVRLAIRHPRLYYAERLVEPKALALFAALALATAGWFAVEPSVLPPGGWPALALPPLIAAGVLLALRSRAAAAWARPVVGEAVDGETAVARFGLGASLALHWLAWRGMERPSPAARAAARAAPKPGPAADGPALIVAIQCESFVDVAARGAPGPELPAYRALCREAVAWGRCRVTAEGAYTMRSEFGFLTGLPAAALGLDALDPFLAGSAYAEASLARKLCASGRRTVFLHPYDRRFFDRDVLAPAFGFERFVGLEGFPDAERFGPYVSDAAVADAILKEAAAATEPTFLFVVTIENHGPWGPGRLPGLDDPAAQYARHLENADRMIGRVAAGLADRPGGALLCVYGDHAPARTVHPGLPDRMATDYALWDSRDQRGTPRRDLDVDALGRLTLERA